MQVLETFRIPRSVHSLCILLIRQKLLFLFRRVYHLPITPIDPLKISKQCCCGRQAIKILVLIVRQDKLVSKNMSPRIYIQVNNLHNGLLTLIGLQIPHHFIQSLRLITYCCFYNLSVHYKIHGSTVCLVTSTYQKLQVSFSNIEFRRLNDTRQSVTTFIE